ncbi:MAG: Ribosome-recycling factor [Mycoplasmataceae bacterium]|nr:MAG: Ribosome-recycling factor [Mycoplasmataceae bacterium]
MNDIQIWNNKIEDLLMKDETSFLNNLEGIRSNRISIDFLKNITVNTSEKKSKLSHLASMRASSARELTITAFNKKDVQSITKALLDADLGYRMERSNGEIMYFSLAPMTEESRKRLIQKSKEILENAKISLRNIRQKILNEIKSSKSLSSDQEKKTKKNIEDIINSWSDRFTKIYNQKVIELNSI